MELLEPPISWAWAPSPLGSSPGELWGQLLFFIFLTDGRAALLLSSVLPKLWSSRCLKFPECVISTWITLESSEDDPADFLQGRRRVFYFLVNSGRCGLRWQVLGGAHYVGSPSRTRVAQLSQRGARGVFFQAGLQLLARRVVWPSCLVWPIAPCCLLTDKMAGLVSISLAVRWPQADDI